MVEKYDCTPQDVRSAPIEEDEYQGGRPSLGVQPPQSDFPQYSEWLGGSVGEQTAAKGQLQDIVTQPPAKSYGYPPTLPQTLTPTNRQTLQGQTM